jgi:uncharacterized protein YqiB (DUF1249 family)
MTLYESNYIRLGWIVSGLRELGDTQVSSVAGDCTLRLSVSERGPYTTTFSLAYLFDVDGQVMPDPELGVRVYHDARLVEALGPARRPAHEALRRIHDRAMTSQTGPGRDRRWARNVMLNKWLEYCAERGHRFAAAPA